MKIEFQKFSLASPETTELARATNGAAWYEGMRGKVETAPPGLVVFDFSGIRLVTISWLREGLLALRKFATALRSDVVLIIANLSNLVQEEFEVALEAIGEAFIAVNLVGDLIENAKLIGHLDAALGETMEAVQGLRKFDATFITQKLRSVGQSAANNRLTALEEKGILKSERTGRTRVYRFILEGLQYGR